MVKKETSINTKIEVELAKSAKTWREDVRVVEETLSKISGEGSELTKQKVQEEKVRASLPAENMVIEVNFLAGSRKSTQREQ